MKNWGYFFEVVIVWGTNNLEMDIYNGERRVICKCIVNKLLVFSLISDVFWEDFNLVK